MQKYEEMKKEFETYKNNFVSSKNSNKWCGDAEIDFGNTAEKCYRIFKEFLKVRDCHYKTYDQMNSMVVEIENLLKTKGQQMEDVEFYEACDLVAELKKHYTDVLFKKAAYEEFNKSLKVLENLYSFADYVLRGGVEHRLNPLQWDNPDRYSVFELKEYLNYSDQLLNMLEENKNSFEKNIKDNEYFLQAGEYAGNIGSRN